jgi:hypothetical protein
MSPHMPEEKTPPPVERSDDTTALEGFLIRGEIIPPGHYRVTRPIDTSSSAMSPAERTRDGRTPGT